ncbi:uncharacterized protein C2845_PM13G08620 [Panicum miliaceum]|uniref:Uncharacterized protein n=1 Tax=Panicum miliaceum TaxID=4540 RepID=A0A3L6RG23_PANMI|nr:uncharacterized protein C2845_PM13G08620 [Panicum miliaceum]
MMVMPSLKMKVAPTQRGGRRKVREATRGVLLHRMNKAMGTRMHISILEGNKRPHVPAQAAMFSSEAGVAVRSQVPILTHWKEYKEQPELFDGFVGRLSVRTTPPVSSMTDAQWCRLVDKWSSAHHKEVSKKNKLNWGRVLLPSPTGSRCYVAQLHSYHQNKSNNAERTEVTEDRAPS